MTKYAAAPRKVRSTVSDNLAGNAIAESMVVITAEAITYLPVVFHGKLKDEHSRAMTYLYKSMAKCTVKPMRTKYVVASSGVFTT